MKVAKAKGRLRGKQPKLKPNQAKHCSSCTTKATPPKPNSPNCSAATADGEGGISSFRFFTGTWVRSFRSFTPACAESCGQRQGAWLRPGAADELGQSDPDRSTDARSAPLVDADDRERRSVQRWGK
jgi:hypothetical protein